MQPAASAELVGSASLLTATIRQNLCGQNLCGIELHCDQVAREAHAGSDQATMTAIQGW